MPSLGFLKKKRTKDSQGSASDGAPTSPVNDKQAGSPITPTLSKNSNPPSNETDAVADSAGPGSLSRKAEPQPQMNPPAATAAAPGQGQQMQGVNASSNTQNVPSIQNLIHQPNYTASNTPNQQHNSGYSSGNADGSHVPSINIPTVQKPSGNPMRETKGKYTLNDFTISRTLGTGSFGRVHLVQSKHNQRFYAVKVLKKAQVVKMKQVEHTNDERRMLQRCRHPFLITLWGTWQDSKNLYMVMDFIEGGELFSLLRKSQRFPNPVAKFYAAEVTLALDYLHSMNIIYR
ncbi:hypothetical protein D0867_15704, partial [Hortaea werneckii]